MERQPHVHVRFGVAAWELDAHEPSLRSSEADSSDRRDQREEENRVDVGIGGAEREPVAQIRGSVRHSRGFYVSDHALATRVRTFGAHVACARCAPVPRPLKIVAPSRRSEVDAAEEARAVVVVGTRTASRSVAMATLLQDCIERHGWSERLRVTVGGLGAGAGRADATDIGMLARDGFVPITGVCKDVGKDQTLLEDAACLVVASAEDAQLFLEWPQAEGKHVLAFTDYVDESAWAIESADSGFRDFMDEIQQATPSLLRALVARPPE